MRTNVAETANDWGKFIAIHVAERGTARESMDVNVEGTTLAVEDFLHRVADCDAIDSCTGVRVVDVAVVRERAVVREEHDRLVRASIAEACEQETDPFCGERVRPFEIAPNLVV